MTKHASRVRHTGQGPLLLGSRREQPRAGASARTCIIAKLSGVKVCRSDRRYRTHGWSRSGARPERSARTRMRVSTRAPRRTCSSPILGSNRLGGLTRIRSLALAPRLPTPIILNVAFRSRRRVGQEERMRWSARCASLKPPHAQAVGEAIGQANVPGGAWLPAHATSELVSGSR